VVDGEGTALEEAENPALDDGRKGAGVVGQEARGLIEARRRGVRGGLGAVWRGRSLCLRRHSRTSRRAGMRASGRRLLGMQAAEHGMTNLPPSRPREALHLRHDARPDPLGAPHAAPEWRVSSPGVG
jgi:hypothetical protein